MTDAGNPTATGRLAIGELHPGAGRQGAGDQQQHNKPSGHGRHAGCTEMMAPA